MATDVMNRNLDDVKIVVLDLLASLWNGGQVVLARGGDAADCDIDGTLEVLTEGGDLRVTFARPSCHATVEKMKKDIKAFERGIVSKKELMNMLVSRSREIAEVVELISNCEQWDQWSAAAEIDRILCLLPDSGEDVEESDWHLPLDYVIQCCRCAVTLIEQLVCRNEKADMSQQRTQLAAVLAVGTTSDGLLVTDTFHNDLHSTEIKGIVCRGGTIRLCALSSPDAMMLATVRNLIDDWYADRLCNRTLCRRLKSCLNKMNVADADWWDRFYRTLRDLWIVAFGKCSKKARASLTGKATREEIYALLDDIEQLVHAPLSHLAMRAQGAVP